MKDNAQSHLLWVTIAIMLVTVMQVLDTTIVNVALPYMAGNLGAGPDQISWVLTSYIVASAIFMPLTGFLSARFGRKRYLLVSISGFVLASALCGLATNLMEIVAFRLLQGIFGAALVPLSQAIIADVYPPEQRGTGMAIWSAGVMVGPILGPSLGGYLTEVFNWRWSFYINVPLGIVSFILSYHLVPETPIERRRLDWSGFILLGLAIGLLQYVLDRGNQEDWLESSAICLCSALALISAVAFGFYQKYAHARPMVNLAVFRNRNFSLASSSIACLGLALYGGMTLQPVMLENLLMYPALNAGLIMAPRGFATIFGVWVVGRTIKWLDVRYLIGAGLILGWWSSLIMCNYTLEVDPWGIIWPGLMQGFGFGLIFVPLSNLALGTMAKDLIPDAAGLYSLLRTLGSSIGISIITTFYTRQGQVHWFNIGGNVTAFTQHLEQYIKPLAYLSPAFADPQGPTAIAYLGQVVGLQANMMAMVDANKLLAITFIILLPIVFLFTKPPSGLQTDAQPVGE